MKDKIKAFETQALKPFSTENAEQHRTLIKRPQSRVSVDGESEALSTSTTLIMVTSMLGGKIIWCIVTKTFVSQENATSETLEKTNCRLLWHWEFDHCIFWRMFFLSTYKMYTWQGDFLGLNVQYKSSKSISGTTLLTTPLSTIADVN